MFYHGLVISASYPYLTKPSICVSFSSPSTGDQRARYVGPLLVGQAMQGPSQATEPGRPGVVRVAQGGAHQVGGVGRHVATCDSTEASVFSVR